MKCAELEKLKGSGGELQIVLKLLEDAQQEAAKLDEPVTPPAEKKKAKGEQRGHGPTEQSSLLRVPLRCELGEAERECPSCDGTLTPMAGRSSARRRARHGHARSGTAAHDGIARGDREDEGLDAEHDGAEDHHAG